MRIIVIMALAGLSVFTLTGCVAYDVASTAVDAGATVVGTTVDAAGDVAGAAAGTVSGSSDKNSDN